MQQPSLDFPDYSVPGEAPDADSVRLLGYAEYGDEVVAIDDLPSSKLQALPRLAKAIHDEAPQVDHEVLKIAVRWLKTWRAAKLPAVRSQEDSVTLRHLQVIYDSTEQNRSVRESVAKVRSGQFAAIGAAVLLASSVVACFFDADPWWVAGLLAATIAMDSKTSQLTCCRRNRIDVTSYVACEAWTHSRILRWPDYFRTST